MDSTVSLRREPLVICAVAAFWVVVMGLLSYLYVFKHSILHGYMADDSFFYLQSARMWVERGVPSLDGIALTNGFHPLWFLLVSGLTYLKHGFLHILAVQTLFHVAAILLLFELASRNRQFINPYYWLVLLLLYPPLLVTSFNNLETSLFIFLISVNLIFFASASYEEALDYFKQGILFGLLFLARTDSLFFAISLSLGIAVRVGLHRRMPMFALAGAAGVLLVASPYLLYNQFVFGDILQSSGKTFLLFQQTYQSFHGTNHAIMVRRIAALKEYLWENLGARLYVHPIIFYATWFATGLLLVRRRLVPNGQVVLIGWCAFSLYLLMVCCSNAYRLVWREWYSAPFYLMFLFNVAVLSSLCDKWRLGRIALVGVLIWMWTASWGLLRDGHWPLQRLALGHLARMTAPFRPDARIGYMDAGIAAYYSPHLKITNLDGAANNEVQPFIARGRLFDYISSRGIDDFVSGRPWHWRNWLMGFGSGFQYAHRGGGWHHVLKTNEEVVANYYRTSIGIDDFDFERWLGAGWSYPVPRRDPSVDGAWNSPSYSDPPTAEFLRDGVWTDGSEAHIYLPIARDVSYEVSLMVKCAPAIEGGVPVQVYVADRLVLDAKVTSASERSPLKIRLQGETLGLMTEVSLKIGKTANLRKLGLSADARDLGLNIASISLQKIDE